MLYGSVTSDVIVDLYAQSYSGAVSTFNLNNTVPGYKIDGIQLNRITAENLPSGVSIYVAYLALDKPINYSLRLA